MLFEIGAKSAERNQKNDDEREVVDEPRPFKIVNVVVVCPY